GDGYRAHAEVSGKISIHALRGEGDHSCRKSFFKSLRFLSTPSVGRATHAVGLIEPFRIISIHALRGEGDLKDGEFVEADDISIHALRGEGDWDNAPGQEYFDISIHALRGEGDPQNLL